MKLVLTGIVVLAIVLIFLEFLLKLLFGFGDPLLYVTDPYIGYRLAPNQKVRRFGNRIEVNEYSMRSGSVLPKRADTKRVLMIGDSIVNGGWWTDQAEILSEVVSRAWQGKNNLEVLNASANSWAPRNELAYLKRFGLFDADVVVLVINTDDLFGVTPSSLVVGHDRNYPDRKPKGAIAEVITRYLLPAPPLPEALKLVQAEPGDRVGANLEAIRQIRDLAKYSNARFVLAMTPLLREVEPPGPRDYELKARQRLQELTETEEIPLIDFLMIFKTEAKQPEDLYKDHIHLSSKGNQLVSEWICRSMQQVFAA